MATTLDKGNIDYKAELLRKSIHLLSISIAVVYYFVTRELALTILIPFTIVSLILDITRYDPAIKRAFANVISSDYWSTSSRIPKNGNSME